MPGTAKAGLTAVMPRGVVAIAAASSAWPPCTSRRSSRYDSPSSACSWNSIDCPRRSPTRPVITVMGASGPPTLLQLRIRPVKMPFSSAGVMLFTRLEACTKMTMASYPMIW
jgi:hypothetical protein